MYIRFKSEQEIDNIITKGSKSSSVANYWKEDFWKYCNNQWRLGDPEIRDIKHVSCTYPLRIYTRDSKIFIDMHKDYLEYVDEPNDILSSEAINSISKLLKELNYEEI